MRVYLAAPYSYKEQLRVYRSELKSIGITVTSRWLDEPESPKVVLSEVDNELKKKYARQDYIDVAAADAVVFFTDPTHTIVRGGRHVEFGLALAWELPVFVVGEKENIFHYFRNVHHFENWEQTKNALEYF